MASSLVGAITKSVGSPAAICRERMSVKAGSLGGEAVSNRKGR